MAIQFQGKGKKEIVMQKKLKFAKHTLATLIAFTNFWLMTYAFNSNAFISLTFDIN